MVSSIPKCWIFISILFVALLAWWRRELNTCINDKSASEQQDWEPDYLSSGQAVNYAKTAKSRWYDYVKKPEGQISILTLLAILIYTGLTYCLTRQNSTAIKISRQSFTDVQRAFVFPSQLRGMYFNNSTYGISAVWMNSGSIPTVGMTTFTSYCAMVKQMPDDYKFPNLTGCKDVKKPFFTKFVIGPKAESSGAEVFYSPLDMTRTNAMDQIQYVWGWARYWDVFQRLDRSPHVTRFCYRLTWFFGNINKPDATTESVSTPCRIGNCADNECVKQGIPDPPGHSVASGFEDRQ